MEHWDKDFQGHHYVIIDLVDKENEAALEGKHEVFVKYDCNRSGRTSPAGPRFAY